MSLLIFVLSCAAAAAPGIFLRPGDWYRGLAKPAWRPPDRVFGPVWAVLYLMIAVAGWLVWRQAAPAEALQILAVYAVQLLLNGSWSILFFGMRRPDLAFFDIVCLWLAIVANIAVFAEVSTFGAALLVPYLLWVTFAAALNYRIWRLNPPPA